MIGLQIRKRHHNPQFQFEPETIALLNRMDIEPTDQRKILINNTIIQLKQNNIWSELDFLYITAIHDQQAARLNWKSSNFTLVEVASPIWSEDIGYVANSIGYLTTGYNPSIDAVNYTLNSNCLGSYHNNGVGNTSSVDMGCYDGVNRIRLAPRVGGDIRISNNSSGINNSIIRGNLAQRFISQKRINSTTVNIWRKDTITEIILQNNITLNSNAIPNAELYLMAINNNGVVADISQSSYIYKSWFLGGNIDQTIIDQIIHDEYLSKI